MLSRVQLWLLGAALALLLLLGWRYDAGRSAVLKDRAEQSTEAVQRHEEALTKQVQVQVRQEDERRAALDPVRAKSIAAMTELKERRDAAEATDGTARAERAEPAGLWLDALRAGNAAITSTR